MGAPQPLPPLIVLVHAGLAEIRRRAGPTALAPLLGGVDRMRTAGSGPLAGHGLRRLGGRALRSTGPTATTCPGWHGRRRWQRSVS
eukprot:13156365-Alexandrium_andersonii.AAC.1